MQGSASSGGPGQDSFRCIVARLQGTPPALVIHAIHAVHCNACNPLQSMQSNATQEAPVQAHPCTPPLAGQTWILARDEVRGKGKNRKRATTPSGRAVQAARAPSGSLLLLSKKKRLDVETTLSTVRITYPPDSSTCDRASSRAHRRARYLSRAQRQPMIRQSVPRAQLFLSRI